MKNKNYKPRVADRTLERKLRGKGAVLIEGAKWCGKTTTAEQMARSIFYMSEMGKREQNIQMARMNPAFILKGDHPRLIDEWQEAPELWDAIRWAADHAGEFGLYILTGSAVPADMSNVSHTGTGRFAWLRMRPMSLWESGDSTGEVSLSQLFDGAEMVEGRCAQDIERMAFLLCRGGWPQAVNSDDDIALDQSFDYVDAVAKRDIQAADGVTRDPEMVRRLMRSYARLQGSMSSIGTIRSDILANETNALTEETIGLYIKALKNIFVVEDSLAWNPNLRSKTAIRSSDTRYFTDPSIATAALGIGPKDLLNDLDTFGLLFETLCVRDLRVFADALNGSVYHYRDKNGLECDAVVHLRDGRYGLVEVKLGGDNLIASGAATLTQLASKLDYSTMKRPSFMMVLTAVGPYAYKRDDGVFVVPIGCLRD